MMNKAVFFDLDGTIIETRSGEEFPQDLDDWKFKKGILPRIRELVEADYKLILITNQAGIEEGYIRPYDFHRKVGRITDNLTHFVKGLYGRVKHFPLWRDIYVASSYDSPYRKPSPTAAHEAAGKYDLNLSACYMIGDASGLERKLTATSEDIEDLKASVGDPYSFFKEGLQRVEVRPDRVLEVEVVTELLPWETQVPSGYGVIGGVRPKVSVFRIESDFSDSDRKFAVNAGMKYIDVEEFIKDGLNSKALSVQKNKDEGNP